MRAFVRLVALIGALSLSAAAAAQDADAQWKAAQVHLAKIQLPLAGTVERFDCPKGADTSDFCLFLYAARTRYFDKDDHVGAIEYAVAALDEKPRSIRALTIIGGSVSRIGRCEEALAYLELVAELENQNGVNDYLHCLIQTDNASLQHSRAVRVAELSARYFNDPWGWWAAAEVHRLGGRFAAARQRAEILAATRPQAPTTWRLYSRLMEDLDEYDAALDAARKALKLRRGLSEIEAENEPSVEDYYVLLVRRLRDTGSLAEALQHTTALAKSSDLDTRETAKELMVEIILRQKGATAAHRSALEMTIEDPEVRADFQFLHHVADRHVADFPAREIENLTPAKRLMRFILLDELKEAERFAATTDYAHYYLGILDFRQNDCSSLGDAQHHWVVSRGDKANIWKDAIISAGWKSLCGDSVPSGINLNPSLSPDSAARGLALHKAAALFVQKDFEGAAGAVTNLPPVGEPVYDEFRALLAAGIGDEAEFRKWEKLAARGPAQTETLPLARLLFHLRRKDAGAARRAWTSMEPGWREQPLLLPLHQAYIGYMVVEAANEVDPQLARDLADVWFRAKNGVLEARVKKLLEPKTDATKAVEAKR